MTEKTDEEIVKEVEKNYGVSTHLIEQVIKTTIPIAKEAEREKHEAEIKEARECVQKNHLCREKGSTNYCIVMSTEGNILCLKPDCKNKICPLNEV